MPGPFHMDTGPRTPTLADSLKAVLGIFPPLSQAFHVVPVIMISIRNVLLHLHSSCMHVDQSFQTSI
jgi:hypothetical protein